MEQFGHTCIIINSGVHVTVLSLAKLKYHEDMTNDMTL